jgi:predicted P-loop ATPase
VSAQDRVVSLKRPRRDPPHSIEAEQSVLGALMLNNGIWSDVVGLIRADDFYRPDHQLVFSAITEMLGVRRSACDFVTLTEYLRSIDKLEEAGGASYLGTLASDTYSIANTISYAEIIRERSLTRQLIAAGQAVTAMGYRPDGRAAALLIQEAEKQISRVALRAAGQEMGADDSWKSLFVLGKSGIKVQANNLRLILQHDPAWADVLAFDEFSNRVVKRKPSAALAEGSGDFTDTDATLGACWLGQKDTYALSVKSSMVLEAAVAAAMSSAYHPVCTYLDGLKWDGEERLPHFFSDFCGAERTDYTMGCGLLLFLSAVARVRKPGCQVDEMVVLEGGQGLGKSQLVRVLGGDWCGAMKESPMSKDFYQCLIGRWIVEIAELGAFSRAEVTKIKEAISDQDDLYRPSYGRVAQKFKRHCIFIGTTNEDQYLRDATGGRRFLPVLCKEINLEQVRVLRDQLWAEADARLKRGEKWWPLPKRAGEEQDARYMEDSWQSVIADWLEGLGDGERYPGSAPKRQMRTDVTEIMRWPLKIEIGKHSRQDQMRVSQILLRLRWERVRESDGPRRWYYRRRGDQAAVPTSVPTSSQPLVPTTTD